ncbi:hypothetical protein FIBSPDRAFT_928926 [Athelia psychrophila]|uniref:Uncharacterized protein n=1 Tax=Athelia psychrophila TaxID=1759441 RepID=A0A166PCU2_9AGAM|nr:hypothetical protein FIBSPDRAFT_932229 [Fibularhizoctonia sp. CBS 109695]KZP25958.1 hypothetical protein FIBSPDRAFT_928926 [Fibularhizoctonia sp. CBS 109695]
MKFTLSTILPIALLAGLATAQAPSIAAFEATQTDVNFQIKVAPAPSGTTVRQATLVAGVGDNSGIKWFIGFYDTSALFANGSHNFTGKIPDMTGGSQEGYDFVVDTFYFSGSSSGQAFLQPGTGSAQLNDMF